MECLVYVLEHVSNYHRASVYNTVEIFHLDGLQIGCQIFG